jgi:hypothetical protein
MPKTYIFNLDDAHAAQLHELSRHFQLAAEDTMRLTIRLAHAQMKAKTGKATPELKPCAAMRKASQQDDHTPE